MRTGSRKTILFLVLFIHLSGAGLSAQTVTRTFRNTPLKQVLEEVEAQTGFSFMYKLDEIADAKAVNAVFNSASLQTVLDTVLGGGFSYSMKGKIVSVTKKPAAQVQKKYTVTGTVLDNTGSPVIGATVMVKGNVSLGGVVTDNSGRFSFTAPQGSVLQVSCIGYKNYEKTVRMPEDLLIELEDDSQALQEVVVVGYGVQNKESVVGAIGQIKGQALLDAGTSNITQTLAGKLSGVDVWQSSGEPGENDATILVRGLSSWNNDAPLVMVDGIERSFSDLDPNEVESISVLKDASATAVFGAKGANGVILVTTKSGVKGRPKMKLTLNYGLQNPIFLPEYVPGSQVLEMANIAYKNQQSFGSMYSDDQIRTTREHTNPLRYPDNDWYSMMIKKLAPTLDANYTLSGGGDKVVYFISLGYTTDSSLTVRNPLTTDNTYSYDKINYRSNLDLKLTPTTKMSLKVGGSTAIKGKPAVTTSELFTRMYMASSVSFPAYFPEGTLDLIPDSDYPDEKGARVANNNGATTYNPYYYTIYDSFTKTVLHNLSTDLSITQKLDFITKGLSVQAKTALTTRWKRTSLNAVQSLPKYDIDWDAYDRGDNPWISGRSSNEVYVVEPYQEKQDNAPSDRYIMFYWEGSMNYNRTFHKRHEVQALALMNQREEIYGNNFPRRTESIVGRVTYNYRKKIFLEGNMGYTGSEQFSPRNRYGFFPSIALGYTVSNEKFWKKSLPWWSKMKFRFSDGLVGSDSASANWLYYSAYTKSNGIYIEQSAANETARWETAHKRDLGLEMGWMDDALTLDVDLFNEIRTHMLVEPVVTPLVGVDYKDINAGVLKKHGFEIEARYHVTTEGHYYYELGTKLGFNENRILEYPDLPSKPRYQWFAGTAYGSKREGMEQIDSGFFNSVDDCHSYPVAYSSWDDLYPGVYKFGDYNADVLINTDDFHPIEGTTYPAMTYSFNLSFGYKGLTFNALFNGNYNKYTEFLFAYDTEFYKGDLVVHKAQTDYWTPTNQDSSVHRSISFNSLFTSQVSGCNYGFTDHTWLRSDYFALKEISLSYKFDSDFLKDRIGIDNLTISAVGNNIFTLTGLIEGDPQRKSLDDSGYYPIVRLFKLGAKINF